VQASLLHDFVASQSENVFMRAFSFPSSQLPVTNAEGPDLCDRFVVVDDIGFVFHLSEREKKVPSTAGDLEKWVANHAIRHGSKRIGDTMELMQSYLGLSLVNGFGHRVSIAPRQITDAVCVIIYRVAAKTRSFRAARFKKNRSGGFIHVLRDTEYFEVCSHFVTPTEIYEYFGFRRDILVNSGAPGLAVSEAALIGQYLLRDFSSSPDPRFEKAALSHGGPTACEFSFLIDTLGADITGQKEDAADTDCYRTLTELARVGRMDLAALKRAIRQALEAVRADRFELPYRVMSAVRGCAFLVVPVTCEFRERAFDALASLSMASKHELQVEKQVGIGMWRTREFVDVEWAYIENTNLENPSLDERLRRAYPFRRCSDQKLPPIFL
jgi:hypothetical protein